jgi:hypothetical protein
MTRLSTRETLRAATAKPPHYVTVQTFTLNHEDATTCETLESTKEIDWNKVSDKKWLMTRHLHWAMLNNRRVELIAPTPTENL